MNEGGRLITDPDNDLDNSGPWCNLADVVAEASKKPFEIKALQLGHSESSLTPGRLDLDYEAFTLDHVGLSKRQKAWPNPNITADPRYAEENRNIFMKLQSRPLRNEFFNPRDEFSITKALPPPDDMDTQVSDSNYLSFFLAEVPQFMGCICCLPQMVNIFMQSVNQPILRHSILALSSAIQQTQGTLASLYIHRNIQKVIPHIQQAITDVKINNAHMVSVTFLGWLALTTGDLLTAHRHIRGLLSMLKVTHHISAAAKPTRNDPHPLAMFLFCMAVKADNYLGSRNQPYAIPPIQFNENYHRQWLKTTTTSEMHLQYCLATIQLDTLANNIGHLQRQARELRASGIPAAEAEIRRRITPMKMEHRAWVSRPYIEHHIKNNDVSKREDFWTTPASLTFRNCFLSYPEYIIFDPLVAYMHLNHTALAIHMYLVESDNVNPHDNACYEPAVLICRIFTALNAALGGKAGKILNGCLPPLWFAGLVFADSERFSQEGMSSEFND